MADESLPEQIRGLLSVEGDLRRALPYMEPEDLVNAYKTIVHFMTLSAVHSKLRISTETPSEGQQHRLTAYAIEQEMLRRIAAK